MISFLFNVEKLRLVWLLRFWIASSMLCSLRSSLICVRALLSPLRCVRRILVLGRLSFQVFFSIVLIIVWFAFKARRMCSYMLVGGGPIDGQASFSGVTILYWTIQVASPVFSIIALLTNQCNRTDAKSDLIGLINRVASRALTQQPAGIASSPASPACV